MLVTMANLCIHRCLPYQNPKSTYQFIYVLCYTVFTIFRKRATHGTWNQLVVHIAMVMLVVMDDIDDYRVWLVCHMILVSISYWVYKPHWYPYCTEVTIQSSHKSSSTTNDKLSYIQKFSKCISYGFCGMPLIHEN